MKLIKKELIKELDNKKIVLGNGFDLFCGLKTSYKNFFESQKENYCLFDRYIDDFKRDAYGGSRYYFRGDLTTLSKIFGNTIWDLVFYLMSNNKQKTEWCDIEVIIKNTFTNKNLIKWNNVLDIIQHRNTITEKHKYEYVCAIFLENKYQIDNQITKDEFYDLLYKELTTFEQKFGQYIQKEQDQNKEYINNAINTLIKFTNNTNQIVSIDTFNYSNISFHDKWCFTKMYNINGTVKHPIFGYFSPTTDPLTNEHRFTKSHRKTLALFENEEIKNDDYFEHLIIFGHSLNEQDYNYFFPLFDELDLNNTNCLGKLIVAFTIYDLDKRKEIIETLTKKLIKMIYEYEKSSGSSGNRLYDKLQYKNRILFYEIDNESEDIDNFINKNFCCTEQEEDSYMSWE